MRGHPFSILIGAALACVPGLPHKATAAELLDDHPVAAADAVTRAGPHGHLTGGTGTNRTRMGRDAFSQPSGALSFDQRLDFALGQAVFERPWVVAPSSTKASDGLGPLFDARACAACHVRAGRGSPPTPGEARKGTMVFALSDAAGRPDPVLGYQLQDRAVPGMTGEGAVRVTYTPLPFAYPDGTVVTLRKPEYATDAPLGAGVALNPRLPPPLIGLGLFEAIADADLLAHADPDDADDDGISGRANRFDRGGTPVLGRFGWKADSVSIIEETAQAFSRDIGLSTRLFPAPHGDCTTRQTVCLGAPHGDDGGLPEVADEMLDLVSFYAGNLAVPARRDLGDPAVLAGEALFARARCTACHVPTFTTAAGAAPEQRNQTIWPYSDFLLHDLGEDLADATPTGDVPGSEWRTPPLWGIGLTEAVNGHRVFLHDGRARTLEEAILWHGGEAAAARAAFAAFSADQRAALLRFLESL
ncbi:putative thiol oxidoreductase with 2 cytochrome c heme-binding site [Rhodovulum sp. P5]|uniref:di-heme oxidoreductase family protein n=1 Tax=Rhodovulum sp. P5 TaxID=1564506 RepID=UPI0009C38344|nr:di-heme oxidoredictase family protein [Rhodovulum sp. P5]ARE40730.1 putative thiol oxidoreductase with 2 cytochrome c heme-binding site [Rhodovulum sp. P5]